MPTPCVVTSMDHNLIPCYIRIPYFLLLLFLVIKPVFVYRYVALEDFENGIKSYQSALRIDSRHYNAWYGLGMIYLRQEKFEFSEHHFRMAFQINPLSSVIMSYLGTALHALRVDKYITKRLSYLGISFD